MEANNNITDTANNMKTAQAMISSVTESISQIEQ